MQRIHRYLVILLTVGGCGGEIGTTANGHGAAPQLELPSATILASDGDAATKVWLDFTEVTSQSTSPICTTIAPDFLDNRFSLRLDARPGQIKGTLAVDGEIDQSVRLFGSLQNADYFESFGDFTSGAKGVGYRLTGNAEPVFGMQTMDGPFVTLVLFAKHDGTVSGHAEISAEVTSGYYSDDCLMRVKVEGAAR